MKVEKHLTLKKVARIDIWIDRKSYKTFSFGDFYLKNQLCLGDKIHLSDLKYTRIWVGNLLPRRNYYGQPDV